MNSHEAQPADELGIVKEMDIKTREKAAKAIKEHE